MSDRVPQTCDCDVWVYVGTSIHSSTRGKLFFSCPFEISDGPGAGCGFMRWWNPESCESCARLKEEHTQMKMELKAVKESLLDHAATIFQMELQLKEQEKLRDKFDNLGNKYEALESKYEALESEYESLKTLL